MGVCGPGQSITQRLQRARTTGATSSIAAATSRFCYVHRSDAGKTIFFFKADNFFHVAILHHLLERVERKSGHFAFFLTLRMTLIGRLIEDTKMFSRNYDLNRQKINSIIGKIIDACADVLYLYLLFLDGYTVKK